MKRRSFLRFFGFGVVAPAVPAIASQFPKGLVESAPKPLPSVSLQPIVNFSTAALTCSCGGADGYHVLRPGSLHYVGGSMDDLVNLYPVPARVKA